MIHFFVILFVALNTFSLYINCTLDSTNNREVHKAPFSKSRTIRFTKGPFCTNEDFKLVINKQLTLLHEVVNLDNKQRIPFCERINLAINGLDKKHRKKIEKIWKNRRRSLLLAHTLGGFFSPTSDAYALKDIDSEFPSELPKIKEAKQHKVISRFYKEVMHDYDIDLSTQVFVGQTFTELRSETFNLYKASLVPQLLSVALNTKPQNCNSNIGKTSNWRIKKDLFRKAINVTLDDNLDFTKKHSFTVSQGAYDTLEHFSHHIGNMTRLSESNHIDFYLFEFIPLTRSFAELRETCFKNCIESLYKEGFISEKDKVSLNEFYQDNITPRILAQASLKRFNKPNKVPKNFFDTEKYFLDFYSKKDNSLYKSVADENCRFPMSIKRKDRPIFIEDYKTIYNYYGNLKRFFVDEEKSGWSSFCAQYGKQFNYDPYQDDLFFDKLAPDSGYSLWGNYKKEVKEVYFDIIMHSFLCKNSIKKTIAYKKFYIKPREYTDGTLADQSKTGWGIQKTLKPIVTKKKDPITTCDLLHIATGETFAEKNKNNAFYTILKHFYDHYFDGKALLNESKNLRNRIDKAILKK